MNKTTKPSPLERDARQRSLVPPERLAACQALVIGVGAIGRQVAWQLAALGVPRLTLIDHDSVQMENLAPQGYWQNDLSQSKVEATAQLCRRLNPEISIVTLAERFRRSMVHDLRTTATSVVFLCVDSIVTRRWIWDGIRKQVAFLVDGRMQGEVIRVVASEAPAADAHYPRTLFTAEEAYAGPCTSRSVIFAASIAAGLMVSQFTKWLRRYPLDPDVTLNLLAGEYTSQVFE